MSAYDKKPVFLIALALLVACTSCGHDDPDVPPTPTYAHRARQARSTDTYKYQRHDNPRHGGGVREWRPYRAVRCQPQCRRQRGDAETLGQSPRQHAVHLYHDMERRKDSILEGRSDACRLLYVLSLHADGGKRERHAVRCQCRPEQSGRIQVVRPYRRLHARRRSIGIAGEHRGTSPDESGGDSAQGRCRI